MKINIDKEKCIGCGSCEFNCPDVFEIKDGKANIKEKVDFEKNKDCIESAIQNCPVVAIEEE
ncbi:MAG: ferredoxin [Candidatus Paceibacterota bacterium]|jgi:ferredoxin